MRGPPAALTGGEGSANITGGLIAQTLPSLLRASAASGVSLTFDRKRRREETLLRSPLGIALSVCRAQEGEDVRRLLTERGQVDTRVGKRRFPQASIPP